MYEPQKRITEYSYSDESGQFRAEIHQVFPGIKVAYIDACLEKIDLGKLEVEESIRIHYCQQGRMERMSERAFFYLTDGDCVVFPAGSAADTYSLPLGHYRGISLLIDPGTTSEPLTALLENYGAEPCVIFRSRSAVGRFFEELYAMAPEQRQGGLKYRIPELLYRLQCAGAGESRYISWSQAELAQSVSTYIMQNLRGKITVKQLTEAFGISESCLQGAFRNVYGMPVIRFIRKQKMQSAARMLLHTSQTIGEIAQSFGYENESKFSAAFKRIMGQPPGVYRKANTTIKIL